MRLTPNAKARAHYTVGSIDTNEMESNKSRMENKQLKAMVTTPDDWKSRKKKFYILNQAHNFTTTNFQDK